MQDRFVKMVMDTDMKQQNKELAKKKKQFSEAEWRIEELDAIFKRIYEDNISGKRSDERFAKLSREYENEQSELKNQVGILQTSIEDEESRSANVERFLSIVKHYTSIPELTPKILHEFVDKIIVHAATDPHGKNRKQEVDIYYKGIDALEMSKVYATRQS